MYGFALETIAVLVIIVTILVFLIGRSQGRARMMRMEEINDRATQDQVNRGLIQEVRSLREVCNQQEHQIRDLHARIQELPAMREGLIGHREQIQHLLEITHSMDAALRAHGIIHKAQAEGHQYHWQQQGQWHHQNNQGYHQGAHHGHHDGHQESQGSNEYGPNGTSGSRRRERPDSADLDALHLDPNVSHDLKTIKRAYNARAKVCHPDRGGDPAEFQRVRQAYKNLEAFHTRNAKH